MMTYEQAYIHRQSDPLHSELYWHGLMSNQCVLAAAGHADCPGQSSSLLQLYIDPAGSATVALGTGVIADISLPHERGKFVGIFQFAGTFSTAST
jgi:hypothetical protein